MVKRLERVGMGLVVGLAVLALAACGGGADGGDAPGAGNDAPRTGSGGGKSDAGASAAPADAGAAAPDYSKLVGWVSLHPAGTDKTYNSGFDGTNDYVVPMTFFADKQPKVTFGDPTAADLSGIITITKSLVKELPDALDGKIQLVLVKTKKAGQTTITAVAGTLTQTATLKITQYTPNDVKVGEARYNNGSPSCNSCHATKAVHNPGLLADLSDETILGIAIEGNAIQQVNTSTASVETVQPNGGNHKWQVTTAERKGLMAFLRSRNLQFQLSGAAIGR